jgi:hypothetical protein
MTYADTPLKICSRANMLCGGDPITSFDDGTAEADLCDAMYEDVARAVLTNSRWRFATKQAVLVRDAEAPTGRFDASYQLPADLLMLSAVTVNDSPILYDTYGDKVFCDSSSSDVVIADYIYRADEADWPPFFTLAVEYSMAAVIATSIVRDGQLSQLMDQRGQVQMMQARRLDSQQQTNRKLNTSRFIAQRRS